MKQFISAVALLVPEYDEDIAYFVGRLGLRLVEDTRLSETNRWVVVASPRSSETGLLLAGLISEAQRAGVAFLEESRLETYGKVAVFRDAFGNSWDLTQRGAA